MAVNVTEIVEEFRAADQQAYLEQYPFADLKYASVFPEQYRSGLKWQAIEAETGAKVAADVVSFNSRAPRKGRPLPGKVSADMPKIEIARDKVETDFNTYRQLMNDLQSVNNAGARSNVLKQVIDWRYEDAPFVVDGVRARLEWIAKRIASTGKYSLTLDNNEAGVQTKIDVDFGIPANQKVYSSADWSDEAGDPIADFKARRAAARANGKILRFAYMEQDTFDIMAANAKVQAFVATYVQNALNLQQVPDLAAVNAGLNRQGLPTIIIWDSFVTIEGKDGSQESVSGWQSGNVLFSESAQLGNTQYTLSADEYVNVGTAQKTKSGIVLVKTWGIEDPITVITKGTAYATPVLNNAKNLHILYTNNPTT
jgi:hypothetical protein